MKNVVKRVGWILLIASAINSSLCWLFLLVSFSMPSKMLLVPEESLRWIIVSATLWALLMLIGIRTIFASTEKHPRVDSASKKEPNVERYKIALSLWQFESEAQWQMFGTFLLPQTVLCGFLLHGLSQGLDKPNHIIALAIVGLLALVLAAVWFSANSRASGFVHLRRLQAQESEPPNILLLGNQGKEFAEGRPATVDGEIRQLPLWARPKGNWAIQFLIRSFAFFDFCVFVFALYRLAMFLT